MQSIFLETKYCNDNEGHTLRKIQNGYVERADLSFITDLNMVFVACIVKFYMYDLDDFFETKSINLSKKLQENY